MKCCLLLLFAMFSGVSCTYAVEVDVLFSEKFRPHVEAVQTFEQGVRADDVRYFSGLENGNTAEELIQLKRILEREPDLLLLVGEDALQAAIAINIKIPTVSIMSMTLRSALQKLMPLTGIDMRPSPSVVATELERQLSRGDVVVSYYNPLFSDAYIEEAKIAFRKDGLRLDAHQWPKGNAQTQVNKSMKNADCYWMQMEYKSVEPDTLRLLFSLAKKGKILVGLSEKYVRAGALLAWTPQAKMIGAQAAVLANRILAGTKAEHINLRHPSDMRFDIRTPDSIGNTRKPVEVVSVPKTGGGHE